MLGDLVVVETDLALRYEPQCAAPLKIPHRGEERPTAWYLRDGVGVSK